MQYFTELLNKEMLDSLKKNSRQKPQVIFKHSTRCIVSNMAMHRIDQKEIESVDADFYFLNIIRHRDLSAQIQQDFDVWHESPQVLVIKDEKCIYTNSHSGIRLEELLEVLQEQPI